MSWPGQASEHDEDHGEPDEGCGGSCVALEVAGEPSASQSRWLDARYRLHRFDHICREHGIEHRLTKPNHPWTNGQVERMNRTIKDATVKRYHYENHDQPRHLRLFVDAYIHARRLKTLRGFAPYEYIAQIWQKEPDRFKINPYHHSAGLDT
jgi:transposase InsO family protein